MAVRAELGYRIDSKEDLRCIKHFSEREFGRLLLHVKHVKNPHLEIIYEPEEFSCEWPKFTVEGEEVIVHKGTLPDFFVKNLNKPNARGTYIEITLSCLNGSAYGNNINGNTNAIRVDDEKCCNGHSPVESWFEYKYSPDPKKKQRRVMSSVVPDARYTVLYRSNLEKIAKTKEFEPLKLDFTKLEKGEQLPKSLVINNP